jgi:hypothetical protein
MFQQQKDWETRENAFAAFTMGPLTDFWHFFILLTTLRHRHQHAHESAP